MADTTRIGNSQNKGAVRRGKLPVEGRSQKQV